MKTSLQLGLALVLLALLATPLGLVALWLNDGAIPVTVGYTHPVPILPGTQVRTDLRESGPVRTGMTMFVWREWCVTNPMAQSRGVLHRRLVGERTGLVYAFDSTPTLVTYAKPGECFARTFAVALPLIPPGRYRYLTTSVYPMNPVLAAIVEWPVVTVDIVP
jgi:hypothetical protein